MMQEAKVKCSCTKAFTESDLPQSLDGKVCIITGGTRGLGMEVTKSLLQRGCHVITGSSAGVIEIEKRRRTILSEDVIPDNGKTLRPKWTQTQIICPHQIVVSGASRLSLKRACSDTRSTFIYSIYFISLLLCAFFYPTLWKRCCSASHKNFFHFLTTVHDKRPKNICCKSSKARKIVSYIFYKQSSPSKQNLYKLAINAKLPPRLCKYILKFIIAYFLTPTFVSSEIWHLGIKSRVNGFRFALHHAIQRK